jgi:hypothetical protein
MRPRQHAEQQHPAGRKGALLSSIRRAIAPGQLRKLYAIILQHLAAWLSLCTEQVSRGPGMCHRDRSASTAY